MQPPVLLPALPLANPPEIPAPWLELPRAVLPSYTPMVYPYAPVTDVGIPPFVEESPAVSKPGPPAKVPAVQMPLLSPPLLPLSQPPSVATPQTTEAGTAQPQLQETTEIMLPGTSIQVPVPKAEILSAAATTSVISVAATLGATAVFKRLVSVFKPLITALVKRVQKMRGKPVQSWARQRLAQRQRRSSQTATPAQK